MRHWKGHGQEFIKRAYFQIPWDLYNKTIFSRHHGFCR